VLEALLPEVFENVTVEGERLAVLELLEFCLKKNLLCQEVNECSS